MNKIGTRFISSQWPALSFVFSLPMNHGLTTTIALIMRFFSLISSSEIRKLVVKITSNPVTYNPVYFESNGFKSNNFKFSYFKFSNLKTSTFESMDFESKDFKSNNYESNNIKCFECYPDHFMDALNGLNWGFC